MLSSVVVMALYMPTMHGFATVAVPDLDTCKTMVMSASTTTDDSFWENNSIAWGGLCLMPDGTRHRYKVGDHSWVVENPLKKQ